MQRLATEDFPCQAHGSALSRIKESYDFSVGEIRTDLSSGKTLVHLGFPLQDPPGVVPAVIIAVVDLSWVTRVTAENHLYPGASFTLVDSRSNVFLRYPQGRDWIAKPIFAKAPDEEMVSRDTEKTVESLGTDGVRRLFAFSQLKSPVGGQSAYAVIDIPAAMAFAEADRLLIHNLITLGLLAALTLVAAWIGTDVFVLRRIRDIVAAGSLVTLLLWVYYSSLMFFFGAELTQVSATRYGSKVTSAENAQSPRPASESQKTPSLSCGANSA